LVTVYPLLVNLLEMYIAYGDVLFHMVHASFIFPCFYVISSVRLNKHNLSCAFIAGNESYWRMLRGKVSVMMDDMIDTAGKLSHLSCRKHNSKIDHLTEGQLSHDLIQ
jgi:hypothetical protein